MFLWHLHCYRQLIIDYAYLALKGKDFSPYTRRVKELMMDVDLKRIAERLPNLRSAVRLEVDWSEYLVQEMLDRFAFEVTGGKEIQQTVGFRMNNLKSIPFSRIPPSIQVEVIDVLDSIEKTRLIKVGPGFREYFAREGVFGRHVDEIKVSDVHMMALYRGHPDGLELSIRNDCLWLRFDLFKYRIFFRNIFSCTTFDLQITRRQRLEELFKADPSVKDGSKWFPNFRFVEDL